MAVSFIQRFFEDALNVAGSSMWAGTKGAFRGVKKGQSWKNRGKDMGKTWNFSMSRGAYDDAVDHWDRSKGFLGKSWFVANAPLHGAHMIGGAAADITKGVLGSASTVVGTGVGLAGRGAAIAGGAVALGTLKAGWALTKAVGPGVAKATYAGGYVAARDTIGAVGAIGKGVWKTRKDPLVGSALMVGAIGVGAAVGDRSLEEQANYGTPDGGKYGTRKGFGYMNTEITGGAWQLNKTGPSSPQVAELQKRINEQGGYEGVHTTKGPMGDELGATGDLVFALNQLRQGGLF